MIGAILYGLLGTGASFAFLYWALLRVQASLAIVILALIPLITLFLAWAHGQESLSWRRLFGALIASPGSGLMRQRPPKWPAASATNWCKTLDPPAARRLSLFWQRATPPCPDPPPTTNLILVSRKSCSHPPAAPPPHSAAELEVPWGHASPLAIVGTVKRDCFTHAYWQIDSRDSGPAGTLLRCLRQAQARCGMIPPCQGSRRVMRCPRHS
jgi:hypothetical protein